MGEFELDAQGCREFNLDAYGCSCSCSFFFFFFFSEALKVVFFWRPQGAPDGSYSGVRSYHLVLALSHSFRKHLVIPDKSLRFVGLILCGGP